MREPLPWLMIDTTDAVVGEPQALTSELVTVGPRSLVGLGRDPRLAQGTAVNPDERDLIHAYWRAANYLSVGQIYLLDNPLLREPLTAEHIKPRLLGHWGTTPGLNLIYAHLNRQIRDRDLNAIYVTGPGHGGPGAGRQRLPGGDLQRGLSAHRPRRRRACSGCFASSRSRAASRATSRPRPRARSTRAASWATACCTPTAPRSTTRTCWSAASSATARRRPAPLAASWHSNKFLNPSRDGAVLPILHLNGYKIANPTVLARIARRRARGAAARLRARAAAGRRPTTRSPCTSCWRDALDRALDQIAEIQSAARAGRGRGSAALADDRAAHAEGLDRAEDRRRPAGRGQLPRRTRCRWPTSATTPSTWRSWRSGCAPTGPRSCSTRPARCVAELAALPPRGASADERQPARQRRAAAERRWSCPTSATTRSRSTRPAPARPRRPRCSAGCCATSSQLNPDSFRLMGPDETASNRLQAVFEATEPCLGRRDARRPTITWRPTVA